MGGKVAAAGVLQLKYRNETFHGGIDEIVLLNRALEDAGIQQLLNGWEDAFDVKPEDKLATTSSRLKSTQ